MLGKAVTREKQMWTVAGNISHVSDRLFRKSCPLALGYRHIKLRGIDALVVGKDRCFGRILGGLHDFGLTETNRSLSQFVPNDPLRLEIAQACFQKPLDQTGIRQRIFDDIIEAPEQSSIEEPGVVGCRYH